MQRCGALAFLLCNKHRQDLLLPILLGSMCTGGGHECLFNS
jgi:hypothetical protein